MHALLLAAETATDSTLLGYALVVAALGITSALVWAATAVKRYFDAKASLGGVWAASAALAELGHALVVDVLPKMGDSFRKALADGKVTPEERKALIDEAFKLGKVVLSEKGLATLEKVFGVAAAGATAILLSHVTRAVDAKIGQGPVAVVLNPAFPPP